MSQLCDTLLCREDETDLYYGREEVETILLSLMEGDGDAGDLSGARADIAIAWKLLTPKQQYVLGSLTQGYSLTEIARSLRISPYSASMLRERAMKSLLKHLNGG